MKNRFLNGGIVLAAAAMLALAGCSSTATSTSAGASARTADPVAVKARADEGRKAEAKKPEAARPAPQPARVERYTDHKLIDAATRTGEVYLLRGLMDVFSRGLDVMGAKINRAGVYALVNSYANWQEIADEIIARDRRGEVSYPVVIIGHSLGANDASKMATYLGKRGVKVSYVVGFDPTEPGYVGANVGTVVNYYLPNGKNNRMFKGSGFAGSVQNVSVTNMDVTHTTIEKDASLQNRVIGKIMGMTKARGKKKD